MAFKGTSDTFFKKNLRKRRHLSAPPFLGARRQRRRRDGTEGFDRLLVSCWADPSEVESETDDAQGQTCGGATGAATGTVLMPFLFRLSLGLWLSSRWVTDAIMHAGAGGV